MKRTPSILSFVAPVVIWIAAGVATGAGVISGVDTGAGESAAARSSAAGEAVGDGDASAGSAARAIPESARVHAANATVETRVIFFFPLRSSGSHPIAARAGDARRFRFDSL